MIVKEGRPGYAYVCKKGIPRRVSHRYHNGAVRFLVMNQQGQFVMDLNQAHLFRTVEAMRMARAKDCWFAEQIEIETISK